MEIIFWVSIVTITYTYFGYPAIIFLLALVFNKPIKKAEYNPKISIILSVFNEERVIEEKIKNLVTLDYPQEKIEILIGSDGSNDKTNEIISKYTDDRFKLFQSPKRQGKPNMLNLLVKNANGEILVFTDARQRIDKEALTKLTSNFSDDKVGSVSAELLFENEAENRGYGVGTYWKYEKFIRVNESKIGSMLGATGAMYAIRKDLFSQLPPDLILDDVYTPLKIVEKGYRAIFEPEAKIYDKISKDAKEEFKRKTRTLAGNFQVFIYLKGLFNPFKSAVAWQLFSHKFLRLIVPFFLISLFLSNIFMLPDNFYKAVFISQAVFYFLAFLGLVFKKASRVINIPYMFCVMNAAALAGFYRFLTGKQEVTWQKAKQ